MLGPDQAGLRVCLAVPDYQGVSKNRFMKNGVVLSCKGILCVTIFHLILIMNASPQVLSDYLPKIIDEWEATGQDRFFYPETLYDYINGGAELFISYGFERVISRTYRRSGQPDILIEIFDMVEPKNAFGVYSHGREQLDDTYGQGSQTLQGAILFWKGPYYISIVCDYQTIQSARAMEKMAQKIDKKIKEEGQLPEIIDWLPEEDLAQESIFYFHHYIWLNAFYYISDDNFLNIDKNTDAVLAKYGPRDTRYFLLLIRYEKSDLASQAYRNFLYHFAPELEDKPAVELEDGKWTGSRVEQDLLICVFNGETEEAVESLISRAQEKYLSSKKL
jgi:hypothetical protein